MPFIRTTHVRAVYALVGSLLLASCGRVGFESLAADARAPDAGVPDTGRLDAATMDGSGPPEGGPGETGPPADAATGDTGVAADRHEITPDDGAVSDCPRLAAGLGRYGVAWRDQRGPEPRVWFRPLDENGAPTGPEAAVSPASASAGCPDVASVPGGFAVAWAEGSPDARDLWLAFLAPDGSVVGLPLEVESGGADAEAPALAFDGARLAVAWVETRGVNAHIEISLIEPMSRAITPLGRQSDDGLFVDHVDIVPVPGGFAYAHYRWTMGGQPAQLHTVAADGTRTGGPVAIGEAEGAGAGGIGLGYNGRVFAVAFVTIDSGPIAFARFANDLTPLSAPVDLASGRGPAMAVDEGGHFGVIYADRSAARLAVLSEDGLSMSPPLSISAPDRSASHGDIARVDSGWLVTWAGGTSGSSQEVRVAVLP